jgi:tRNA 2-thiocytidine biosynthesis protein TtcA
MALQRKAPVRFELLAVNLDQKQPGVSGPLLPEYFASLGYRVGLSSVTPTRWSSGLSPEERPSVRSAPALRRGILYNVAVEEGCTKIALGHHADDILQTFLLNLFYIGTLKAMPPALRSDDGAEA